MRKIYLLFALMLLSLVCNAKSYPWEIKSAYEVQVVRVAQQGTKFYKAWGIAGSPDKAITMALQDAVAATIFTGVAGNETAGSVPPLCSESGAYEQHKAYFDTFFKKGEFLNYVENVNKNYPSGENNVSVKGGRRVGVYVKVMYDELRKKLESDGIIKSMKSYF